MKESLANLDYIHSIPTPALVVDIDLLKIRLFNSHCVNLFGYSDKEFKELILEDLFEGNEFDRFRENVSSSRNINELQEIGGYTHLSKLQCFVYSTISVNQIQHKGETFFVLYITDVSENKKLKTDLQKANVTFSSISSISKIGYWRNDLTTGVLSWTDEIYKIWGKSNTKEEVTYDSFKATIHPEDLNAFHEAEAKLFSGNEGLDFKHRIVLPEGDIKWVHELGRLTHDHVGNAIAIEGTVQDITDRVKEEHRLKLLESVITNTKDAVMITEAEPLEEPGPRIIYVNEAFTKMTGYTSDEVLGRSPRFLQGPKTSRKELNELNESLSNWRPHDSTVVNYKKNGEEFWINFTLSPVSDKTGWFTHWIAIERDITEQKNKELKKELLSEISRDFREGKDFLSSASRICETIGNLGSFDLVELWTVNIERSGIDFTSSFTKQSKDEKFYGNSSNVKSFLENEGLPGTVWYTKNQVVWNSKEMNSKFVRLQSAKEISLNGVLGMPLISNGEVIGVLLIGSKNGIKSLLKYSQIFKEFEQFIGSELNRKLLESEIQTFVSAIPDIVCVLNKKGRFLKVNERGSEILEYTRSELLNKRLLDLELDSQQKNFLQLLSISSKKGDVINFTRKYSCKGGNQIWLDWNVKKGDRGNYFYASGRDVTNEMKLIELSKQASQLASIGSWEINLISDTVYWSSTVYEIHGIKGNSFEPNYVNTILFYREDFRSMVYESFRKCVEEHEPFDYEAIIIDTSGNEKWIRAIGKPEIIKNDCVRIFGSFQDVTKLKESSLELINANQRFDKVTEATSDAIWDWNIIEDILFWGKGYEKVFGFSPQQVEPKLESWIENIFPDDRQEVIDQLNKVLSSNDEIWEVEYRYLNKKGKVCHVLDRGLIIRDESNKPIRMVGAMQDITQKKQREIQIFDLNKELANYTRELEKSNEELDSFAFITSHDLQEPLRTISNFMDILKSKYEDQLDEKAQQYITFAIDGAKRLKKMIAGLLDYSRIGKTVKVLATVNFNEVLNDYTLLRHKSIKDSSAKLNYRNLPEIECFKAGVVQVLHVLLDNAIKYSKEEECPIVSIEIDELNEFWQFSISDNGIGIDPTYHDKVFEVFQRLQDKSEYPGTGIGLSIAKRQVENMGGEIWLNSNLNNGSTFSFTIPKIANI